MKESEDEKRFGRATRMTAFVVFILAASMFAVPSLMTGGHSVSPAMNAAAADIDRTFEIGTSELAISTLNPFTYTMADEYMVIWPAYSTLITWDEDVNRIGDLATSWTMSPDGLTWNFKIVDNAYFICNDNPYDTSHQLTVDDVIYTYELVQDYTSNLHFYFPGEIDGVPDTIQSMTKINNFEFTLQLSTPYAPFLGALSTIPIVPKFIWQPLVDVKGSPDKVIYTTTYGTGPFYYDMDTTPDAGVAPMKRNPTWFQETNRGWQIHVDTLNLKDMTDPATAWLNLQLGNIDVFMGVPPTVYVNDLPGTPDVIGYAQSTGFVYEYNLNQMSDEMRSEFGGAFNNGDNNQLLLDPVIKLAMAMCVDKTAFIANTLQGLGTVSESLIPDISPWYYDYGSTPGEVEIPFDPQGARELLWNNGWKYDAAGREVAIDSDQCPLYGYVDDELVPLSFRFYTLNTESEWLTGAQMISQWHLEAGIDIPVELKSSSEMNSIWWSGDYDTWLWDWMFTPLSDPSTDVMSVLTTMEIGSWSDVYYSDPVFDDIYNRSLVAMDPTARGELVDEMQRMAYEDMGCQCIAFRKELYAVSTKYWTGYGDWNTEWILMPDQGFPYVYMHISPNGVDEGSPNTAPSIIGVADTYEGTVGSDISFSGSGTDTSPLNYQWYWGDGSKSGWLTSGTTTHQYSEDGIYTVYFAAKEMDGDDGFISWKKATVTVIDLSNTAPHDLSIDYEPLAPDTGDVITFTGDAIDDNGDELYFTWNFGDTYTALGQVVTHQYLTDGDYTVTMYVTDNHHGSQPRPVSTSVLVSVAANNPPTINVGDETGILKDVNTLYTVTASDPDAGDSLRFTWDWGDGGLDVTTVNTCWHTYTQTKTFTLTVYADDLTNLPGHNVSDTGLIEVINPDNSPPSIVTWSVDNANPYTGEVITFTASAKDGDKDELTFTFVFGDGTTAVEVGTPTNPQTAVTFSVDKSYATSGYKTARVYVNDGTVNQTSAALSINVVYNAAPDLIALSDMTGSVGELIEFTAYAIDLDGDPLTYFWEFGDDSYASGNPVTHTYATADEYVFRVWVDDAHGHNVTSAAIITIGVAQEFTLDLVAGWNLISVPLVNHDYMASTLGLSFGDMVSRWDPATQTYDKNYIVGISGSTYDFAIEPSWSYWVFSGAAKSVVLSGDAPTDPQSRTITVPSGGGWVQAGIASLSTELWASDLADMYPAGQLTMVSRWNAGSGTYSNYLVLPGIGDFQLSPGDGLWLYVLSSGTLSYVP